MLSRAHLFIVFLALAIPVLAQPLHEQIYQEAKNPRSPTPGEQRQASQLSFVFIGGILNEAQMKYGEDWLELAESFGFSRVEFWSQPSVQDIETNCKSLSERLRGIGAFVAVSHSKGSPELLCALTEEEKLKWKSAASVNGAFFGSPLSDFHELLCNSVWSGRFFCNDKGIFAGFLSLTREKVRSVIDPRLARAKPESLAKLKKHFVSIRTDGRGRDLEAPLSMTLPLLSMRGANDGILMTDEQKDPHLRDLGVLSAAHNDLVSAGGVPEDLRQALVRIVIRDLLNSSSTRLE
jgi:hypothetical protein